MTDWPTWFAAKAIEAQRRALLPVEFVLAKARLMAGLPGRINTRQERALLRLFKAGLEGFVGGLSAANSMGITGAPPAKATRDLVALVGLGALLRTGALKSARYRLNGPLEAAGPVEAADISKP